MEITFKKDGGTRRNRRRRRLSLISGNFFKPKPKIIPTNYDDIDDILYPSSAEFVNINNGMPFNSEEKSYGSLPQATIYDSSYLLDGTEPGYSINIGTVEHKPSMFNRITNLFSKKNKVAPAHEPLRKPRGGKRKYKTKRKYFKRYQ